MALFKILKGAESNLINQAKKEGHAYFTVDENDFYIDTESSEVDKNGNYIIENGKPKGGTRKQLNSNRSRYVKSREDSEKVGYHALYIDEKEMPNQITNLLVKHKPDILIVTGHDNYKVDLNKKEHFENSKYFIQTVKKARIYQADKDALVIFAGACQSYYEALIESGANFASSPTRQNINVLDPVYIAISVAKSHVGNYIDVEETLKKTVSKGVGLGGIDTKGVARRLY